MLVVDEGGTLSLLRESGWPADGPPMRTPGRAHPLSRAVSSGEPIWNAGEAAEGRSGATRCRPRCR